MKNEIETLQARVAELEQHVRLLKADRERMDGAVTHSVKAMSQTAEKLAVVGELMGFQCDASRDDIAKLVRKVLADAAADRADLAWMETQTIRDRKTWEDGGGVVAGSPVSMMVYRESGMFTIVDGKTLRDVIAEGRIWEAGK